MTTDTHGPHAARDANALSPHRTEALTDGIYAVAMTLLVIDLKLPEGAHIATSAALLDSLAALTPKFIAWLISFFVLASFWLGHHRLFNHLRHTDRKLVRLNLMQLSLVTLMPFSCSLTGEHQGPLVSQIVYALNMVLLAGSALIISHHVYKHPELSASPPSRAAHRGVLVRTLGLMLISVATVALAAVFPYYGNTAFMLMAVVARLAQRVERRGEPATDS